MARSSPIAALALALVGASAAPAGAQKPKVAVLPFNGPQGPRAQGEAVRALRRRAEIVPQAAWDEAAQNLFATSRSAEDMAAVAKELGVQVIVTGTIKRDGGWVLIVSARNGGTGKTVEKLKYPLRGPRLDPISLRRMADEIGDAVDKAAAGGGAGDAEANEPAAEPTPTTTEDTENPLAAKQKPAEPEPARIERPRWAPFVDASVAFVTAGRHFAFDQPMLPEFRSILAPGLRIDLNAFPLAFLGARPGALWNGLSGLGVGLTLDAMFWPDSVPCTRDPMTMKCVPTTERFSTQELRFEAGLRYHWNVLNQPLRPELLASLQYGLHTFTISKKMDGTDVGPPDVSYGYLTIGLGGRMPFTSWIAAFAVLNLHLLLDAGPIHTAAQYGPGGGWGVRATLGAEATVWKGLTVRVSGFYEHFGLSFFNSTMSAKMTTGGANDQYYGFQLGVGYVF